MPGTMLTECLAGTGVCQVLAIAVRDLLDEGRLVNLVPDWPDETFPLPATGSGTSSERCPLWVKL
jgi:DNA-binding transcriptional LysR family regulator